MDDILILVGIGLGYVGGYFEFGVWWVGIDIIEVR